MLTIPSIDLPVLWPFMAVAGLAILVLLTDLFGGAVGRKLTVPLAVLGCVGASVFILGLPDAPQTGFADSLVNAGITQWISVLFLLAAGLSIQLSAHPRFMAHAMPGEVASLVLFSTAGMILAVQARDFVVLFLGIELTSLPIYCLVGLNKQDRASNEAALKYFLLGAFSAALYLFGLAIVFGTTGSLNYTGVANFNMGVGGLSYSLYGAGHLFIFVSLAFKAAMIPFHMWAPDAYQGAPAPIAGFMSAAVKAMAITVFLLVCFPLTFIPYSAMAPVVGLTVLGGNLLALVQTNVKRMLAYSSIAHAGYLGLVFIADDRMGGLGMVVFYLFGYTMMSIGAFAVAGWVAEGPTGECSLQSLRGLHKRSPFSALAMAVFMLGMAGIPPLAGFMGKLFLFKASISGVVSTLLIILAALGSAVGVYYYLRVVVTCYMEDDSENAPVVARWPITSRMAIGFCVAGTVVLGLFPEPLLKAIEGAARAFVPF